jgi:uncharacterized membrane protein YdbT with pleckstrin-like domain
MHYDARPAWRYQWSAVMSAVAALLMLAVVGVYGPAHLGERATHVIVAAAGALALYFLLLMLYRRLSWRYLIDEHSIDSYHGILARHVHSVRIENLRNVEVKQSAVQRVLNVGDIEFSSVGAAAAQVVFFGVTDPLQVLRLAQQVRSSVAVAVEQ